MTSCVECHSTIKQWTPREPDAHHPFGIFVPICLACWKVRRQRPQAEAWIQREFGLDALAYFQREYGDRAESTRTLSARFRERGVIVSHEYLRRWLTDLGVLRHDRSEAVASQWHRDQLHGGERIEAVTRQAHEVLVPSEKWMADPEKVKVIGMKIAHTKAGSANAVFHPESKKRTYPGPDGQPLFRGSWEYNVSHILTELGQTWTYEPRHFVLPDDADGRPRTYTPDFRVGRLWIEVKGLWRPAAIEKIALFRSSYPDETLAIVEEPIYLALRELFRTRPWWAEPSAQCHGDVSILAGTVWEQWIKVKNSKRAVAI